ncbi:MAG TPA: OmpA family protein [Sedimenticola sp.]|nr:OmpA family protein [Sedimenticola sp.]
MEYKKQQVMAGLVLALGLNIGLISAAQAVSLHTGCDMDCWACGDLSPECEHALPDSDGDGVMDDKDQCPATPAGVAVDAVGCPLDSDGDGVVDHEDRCPGTPAGVSVDAQGCPLDSDGDGVTDDKDRCPGTPRGAAVDTHGCELDSDGDGVLDSNDACPGTPRGARVDARGCQVIENITIDLVNDEFDFDSAALKPDMKSALDDVARRIKASKGDEHLLVIGHTDSVGSDAYNQRLSERRAKAAAGYLISRGIDATRIRTKGVGESQPVADNSTKSGRAKNRRVEIRVE